MKVIAQLIASKPSSADVERVVSTFGLVHPKIRIRLGMEKAGKLVFMYNLLNMPGVSMNLLNRWFEYCHFNQYFCFVYWYWCYELI